MDGPSLNTVVRVGVVELSHTEHGHDAPAAGRAAGTVAISTIPNVVTTRTATRRRHRIMIIRDPSSLEAHVHMNSGAAHPGRSSMGSLSCGFPRTVPRARRPPNSRALYRAR